MSNIWNLFWIFIILVSVLPIIQQKIMQAKRFALIRKLEKKRNSRVITLIHRQETMRFLGFPLMRYIDINDSEEILRAVRHTLTEGKWTHDYPITFEEAKKMGFPVTAGLPEEIYQLMDLFPQAIQQRPSVQYIPVPYKPAEREKRK